MCLTLKRSSRPPCFPSPFCTVALAALAFGSPAVADVIGFSDFNDARTGIQSAAWPQPATLWVTLPANLTEQQYADIREGADTWDDPLQQVDIRFSPPETGTPPEGAGIIDVQVVDASSAVLAGHPGATDIPPPDFSHDPDNGYIWHATIYLSRDLLNNRHFLQNLSAHEMGHALGLDNSARQSPREDVMDDGLDSAPLVPPSARDIAALAGRYTVPTPGAAALLGTGGLVAMRRRR